MFDHLATSANKISLIKWKKVADYGDYVIDIPHNFNMHKTLLFWDLGLNIGPTWDVPKTEKLWQRRWTGLTHDGGIKQKKGKKRRKQKGKKTIQINQKLIYTEYF